MKLLAVLVLSCIAVAQAREISFQPIVPFRDVTRNSRIVNGFPASPGQFPYQAFLSGQTAGGNLACGGSLISSEWVLTAAHCQVGVISFTVRVGTNNINEGTVRTSSAIIIHPAYNANNLNNDIGLIRLNEPVPLGGNIQVVALPEANLAETFLNRVATVSGFGRTSDASGAISQTLNFVHLNIISNIQCMGTYGAAVVIDSTVCALGRDAPNQGTCNGDSGGPLTVDENGQSLQIGVVSFVAAVGCEAGLPSGYVRTTHFREWIRQQSGV
ncbi:brachyurin-like [Anopheles bellator]|uniref:brachyurin-like n=1 Tax=Anopheles bellator TaxID=139047 RepID=UPI002649E6A6|nr:brachyurin-like [Anopheles bellator]